MALISTRCARVRSNDEASIMVVRTGGPRPFEQDSSLFASINEGYAEAYGRFMRGELG